MRVAKKIKEEALKVYDTWLYSYLNGDVATYDSYLDEGFRFIGSTDNEEFLNREDTTNFFNATAEQLSGKSQLRNETKIVAQHNDLIFITHLFDAWFKTENDWTYYNRFRFTNALQKQENGWKFIYQHYSTPDSKAQEGETIGYEQVHEENSQLREAIQRRTKELEDKNRALEIEGALQRIRAEAVAMKESSDLLDIVVTLRREFVQLGHEAHYFWHMMWLAEKYEKAMTSGDGNRIGFVMELPRHIHGDIPLLAKWEKSKKPMVVYAMDADEAIAYVDKMVRLGDFKNIDPQAPSNDDIRHINGLTFIMARTSHGEIGYSLPGKVENPPAEDLHLLQQFAGAFDLAHRRFLDLQKSENQAREVQIQLALEKIRSRTMAMQHSEELTEVGALLYRELSKLGIQNLTTGYVLFDDTATMGWNYGVNPMDGSIRHKPVGMNHTKNKVMKMIASSWKMQEPVLVIQLNKKETIKHQTFIAEKSIDFPISKEKLLAISPERLVIHTFNFKHGYLLIVGGTLLISKQQEVITRFAKVFEQTYTRFLDLQKAEAQAREAQIEASLERVRSRGMAMQQSDEIGDVAMVLYEQLISLGGALWGTGFGFCENNAAVDEFWFVNERGVLPPLKIPHTKDPTHKAMYKGWQDKLEILTIAKEGVELEKHYNYMLSVPSVQPIFEEMLASGISFPTWQKWHAAYFKFGYLLVITTESYGDEEIFIRFAKVFEQTYTRFLDLQKAEEQIREAQIENALEKVRSRTMAMQHSEELPEAANVLFTEIQNLGIPAWSCGYNILSEDKKSSTCIMSSEGEIQSPFTLPLTEHKSLKPWHQAILNNKQFFVYEQGGTDLKEHYDYMQSLPDLQKTFRQLMDAAIPLPTFQVNHLAEFTNGFLLFITYERVPEAHDIFQRFAKVFEQTYTRFLDLQKAEAQNRESQIQLSLERVRARTMAMQHSDELIETSEVLFRQIKDLGIEVWSCGYSLWYDNDSYFVGYNPMPNGKMGPPLTIPLTEDVFFKTIRKAKREGKEFLVFESKGKSLVKTYQYMDRLPVVGETMRAIVASGYDLPTYQITHCGFFSHGHLMFITHEHYPEAHDTFKRFTKEFEQTYTRFLDLQKAEAQAREAQIEAALERVRSRSMAMHASEELEEVIQVVYNQFVQLDIKIEHAGFILDYKKNEDMHIWLADHNAVFPKIVLPYFDCAHWNSFRKAKKKGLPFFANTLDFDEKNKFYNDLFKFLPDVPEATKATYFDFDGLAISTVLLEDIGLYIENYAGTPFSEEENDILMRFGKVFQQTYTRFLDLQKAEAQFKEAKIEAALEKVRSRSLAMHSTEEIEDVVLIIVEKLKELGVILDPNGVTLCTYFPNSKDVLHWIASPDFSVVGKYLLPHFDHVIFNEAWHSKEKGDVYFSKSYSIEDKNSFFEYAFEHSDYRDLPKEFKQWIFNNDKHILSFAWQKHSAILIPSNTGVVPNEDEKAILIRFSKVFEQAYIRFMDLQTAEKQAHEAKIEASLEKVRSVALSLQKANDMLDIAKVLYEQLLALGFTEIRNAIIDIHNDATETFIDYDYSHDMSSAITEFSYYGDPIIEQQIKKTQSGNDAFFEIELKGEQLKELIETRLRNGEKDDPRLHKTDHLTYNLYSFGNGAIGISNFGILSDEQKKVLKRFRNVFTFAYKRYTDLAKAEAQAREAKIEAALEKVRSVALSMDESTDLLHIAKALYEQLVELGFNDIRNALIDVNNEDEQTFLDYDYSHEMGGTITLMSYDDDPTLDEQVKAIAATTDGFSEMVLEGQQLQDLIDMRRKNGEADDPRLLNADSLSYILYAFGNGAIGISNFGILSKDQKEILDRFRKVFTFAYQRFEDLQVKEEQSAKLLDEKLRLEKTLTDLQQTQKQLIQSEKMASLGELTAGIAHEIQNPLNFVNNFSEVSNELMDEMNEEIDKGDLEEAKSIASDIKKNLEKINHHGKRADAIVKGMLQHSRKSTADKVPTDINKLADEYLRLAYHGLRAKDKTFNATLETQFDTSIEPIKIIPQDIGRVILNLITNAFYATNERKNENNELGYKPIVLVTTEKRKDAVSVSVKDNGTGIPKHVVEKIFQPFYTTKPTGEGTGLGLSMSYDIVTKGHGGALTVKTKNGVGTTFTIKIPIKI